MNGREVDLELVRLSFIIVIVCQWWDKDYMLCTHITKPNQKCLLYNDDDVFERLFNFVFNLNDEFRCYSKDVVTSPRSRLLLNVSKGKRVRWQRLGFFIKKLIQVKAIKVRDTTQNNRRRNGENWIKEIKKKCWISVIILISAESYRIFDRFHSNNRIVVVPFQHFSNENENKPSYTKPIIKDKRVQDTFYRHTNLNEYQKEPFFLIYFEFFFAIRYLFEWANYLPFGLQITLLWVKSRE